METKPGKECSSDENLIDLTNSESNDSLKEGILSSFMERNTQAEHEKYSRKSLNFSPKSPDFSPKSPDYIVLGSSNSSDDECSGSVGTKRKETTPSPTSCELLQEEPAEKKKCMGPSDSEERISSASPTPGCSKDLYWQGPETKITVSSSVQIQARLQELCRMLPHVPDNQSEKTILEETIEYINVLTQKITDKEEYIGILEAKIEILQSEVSMLEESLGVGDESENQESDESD